MGNPILVSLPDQYKVNSLDPFHWPGAAGQPNFSRAQNRELSDSSLSTDNGQALGSTIVTGNGRGSLYTESGGFNANVVTKTSTTFYTLHFIGHQNGTTVRSGSSISTSTQSTWLRDVIGFYCEIRSQPRSGGSSSQMDGCGRVDKWRVAAVYADSSNKVRIMEMTKGGTKLGPTSYDSYPGTTWSRMSYALSHSDSMTVVNGKWRLYGWLIEFSHKKTCGGSTKQKYCTGEIRYLRPLISSTGTNGLVTEKMDKFQLVYHWENTLSTATGNGAKMLQHY